MFLWNFSNFPYWQPLQQQMKRRSSILNYSFNKTRKWFQRRPEPCQTSNMECFAKTFKGWKSLFIFAKYSTIKVLSTPLDLAQKWFEKIMWTILTICSGHVTYSFQSDPHSIVAWMSRNSLLEAGAKSEV